MSSHTTSCAPIASTSVTSAAGHAGPAACSATCSGRTPSTAATAGSPWTATTSPSMKFMLGEPRKPATNMLAGRA